MFLPRSILGGLNCWREKVDDRVGQEEAGHGRRGEHHRQPAHPEGHALPPAEELPAVQAGRLAELLKRRGRSEKNRALFKIRQSKFASSTAEEKYPFKIRVGCLMWKVHNSEMEILKKSFVEI